MRHSVDIPTAAGCSIVEQSSVGEVFVPRKKYPGLTAFGHSRILAFCVCQFSIPIPCPRCGGVSPLPVGVPPAALQHAIGKSDAISQPAVKECCRQRTHATALCAGIPAAVRSGRHSLCIRYVLLPHCIGHRSTQMDARGLLLPALPRALTMLCVQLPVALFCALIHEFYRFHVDSAIVCVTPVMSHPSGRSPSPLPDLSGYSSSSDVSCRLGRMGVD